jgi:hypothetical protein
MKLQPPDAPVGRFPSFAESPPLTTFKLLGFSHPPRIRSGLPLPTAVRNCREIAVGVLWPGAIDVSSQSVVNMPL